MPDIAMCSGDGCPKKLDCYRHRTCPEFLKIMRGDTLCPPEHEERR